METTERVLFVDDDEAVRVAFERVFKRRGFEIDVADGPEAGLRRGADCRYAAIVVDYRMPSMDGLQLVDALRGLQPNAAYLLLSAECDVRLAMEALNTHGVQFVVTKPWDTPQLALLLRKAIASFDERVLQSRLRSAAALCSEDLVLQGTRLRDLEDRCPALMTAALLNTLAVRDYETLDHCRRVAAYSARIASALSLPAAELEPLRQGALLHDIGKIGIPDAILLKPGPLSAEEWTIMREHPRLGAQLLEGAAELAEALPVVLQHHERWDGSGYPAHLRGDAISHAARIFAVADALDAMVSLRPYRRPLTLGEARRNISLGAGTQFDPAVVATFEEIPTEELSAIGAAACAEGDAGARQP